MHSTLSQLKDTLEQIPDPRSKQGVSHPFAGILALVLLGKIARKIYMSHIADWAEQHWHELKTPLGFDSRPTAHDSGKVWFLDERVWKSLFFIRGLPLICARIAY